MELIERDEFLAALQDRYEGIVEEDGHCVFIGGESGIGKTSVVKEFCRRLKKNDCNIYQGSCDALFTPRPLAPLYDIAWQLRSDLWPTDGDISDRAGLFIKLFHELSIQDKPIIIVFEDIHWADEATLDFIKFMARRITRIHCLFILTFRDTEIYPNHPLRNIMSQLNPDSFSRMQLQPLSRQAVERMASEKGYSGEDVYSISGGIPFYVNEILASYSPGIPENIKDAVLSVYHKQPRKRRDIWDLLSVFPTGFEVKYLEKMEPEYAIAIENCMYLKILIEEGGRINFKHQLYRSAIETSLSPFARIALNKKILDLFLESFEENQEIERIIHHAKNANEYELVVHYAPLAARQAATVGAHIEASKLYLTAIEYYAGNDKDKLIQFYEGYSYECYLTNQPKEAIIYQGRALNLWKEKGDITKMGNCMRFLSRLWWFEGNRKQAENYAAQAIEVLEGQPSSSEKAMAYSNMSQLKMLSGQLDECLHWGEKAIAIADELDDKETLSHALNNVGFMQMRNEGTKQKGIELMLQSLDIALKNSYHEHAARAYTNLVSNAVDIKDYDFARKTLEEGLQYCEERDLDSWTAYMSSWKARVNLETGCWDKAYCMADSLVKNENQSPIIKIGALVVLAMIKMRKGEGEALPLLMEAKTKAFGTMELQRIIPAMVGLLEYEWITGKCVVDKESIDLTVTMLGNLGTKFRINEFAYWLRKVRKQEMHVPEPFTGYQVHNESSARKAAALWEQLGCPYAQALALFEGSEADKRKAISIVQELGAASVFEKMKLEMRSSGIKSIPRGIRNSTRANPAFLTSRELDVLQLLKEGLQNKEIATKLYISAKTVDHHISAVLFKLNVNSRSKAVQQALQLGIIK